jgi:hypothetical protein
MHIHYTNHAKDVVDRFKKMLTQEQIDTISNEHFDELETLLIAALGVVHSDAKHGAAKDIEALAHQVRLEAQDIE